MTDEQTKTNELRDLAYAEVVELFEGDRVAAERWLSSPVHALGNRTPIALMETKLGIEKIRTLVGQLERGVLP